MKFLNKIQDKITYVRIIAVGYLTVILVGTGLLMLPVSTAAGEKTGFLSALFTATSATCVTGLVIADTATHWTLFGQTVILFMIQVGGLGFMTMGVLLAVFLRKRISLRARGILQESMNYMQMGGVIRLLKTTFKGTLLFEGVGALLLAVRFIPVFGVAKGIFFGVFHSISAFCNGGFDLMGTYSGQYSSFVEFHGDVLINLVLMALVVLGGIGFFVWSDVKKNGLRWKKYMLHTKITLFTTAVLLVAGTMLYFVFENQNLLAGMSGKDKFLAAAFSSVTARTEIGRAHV